TKSLPTSPDQMAGRGDYRDTSLDLNTRARSYLHANCSHCHRKWGGGNAEFQLLATLDLGDMGIVGVRPNQGTFNLVNAKLLAPHDPYRSVLFYRMSTLGPGHMPRLGTNTIDEAGVKLIHDWIASLPAAGLLGATSQRATLPTAAAVKDLRGANLGSDDEMKRRLDPLLASPSASLQLLHALADDSFPAKARDAVVNRATASETPEIRDLFERYLPEEKRIKRLGA